MQYNSTIMGPTCNIKTKGEIVKVGGIEFKTKMNIEMELLTKDMLDYENPIYTQ